MLNLDEQTIVGFFFSDNGNEELTPWEVSVAVAPADDDDDETFGVVTGQVDVLGQYETEVEGLSKEEAFQFARNMIKANDGEEC